MPTEGHVDIHLLFIAGSFALGALLLTTSLIFRHLSHYHRPVFQKNVVRICLIVPVYALEAYLSLLFPNAQMPLETLRDSYEAYVIWTFMSLMISFLGGDLSLEESISKKGRIRQPWPLHRMKPLILDAKFVRRVKQGCLQFVFVKPFASLVALLMDHYGAYGEGELAVKKGFVYVSFVTYWATTISLYCLYLFYLATKDALATWNPWPKFLCVKAVIFFSYWQSVALVCLVKIGIISDARWAIVIQDCTICVEMFLAAIAFEFAFPVSAYSVEHFEADPARAVASGPQILKSIKEVVSVRDVLSDAHNAFIRVPDNEYELKRYKGEGRDVPIRVLDEIHESHAKHEYKSKSKGKKKMKAISQRLDSAEESSDVDDHHGLLAGSRGGGNSSERDQKRLLEAAAAVGIALESDAEIDTDDAADAEAMLRGIPLHTVSDPMTPAPNKNVSAMSNDITAAAFNQTTTGAGSRSTGGNVNNSDDNGSSSNDNNNNIYNNMTSFSGGDGTKPLDFKELPMFETAEDEAKFRAAREKREREVAWLTTGQVLYDPRAEKDVCDDNDGNSGADLIDLDDKNERQEETKEKEETKEVIDGNEINDEINDENDVNVTEDDFNPRRKISETSEAVDEEKIQEDQEQDKQEEQEGQEDLEEPKEEEGKEEMEEEEQQPQKEESMVDTSANVEDSLIDFGQDDNDSNGDSNLIEKSGNGNDNEDDVGSDIDNDNNDNDNNDDKQAPPPGTERLAAAMLAAFEGDGNENDKGDA